MTDPPQDGGERDAGIGGPSADWNLTRPVQPYDRPPPFAARTAHPSGEPGRDHPVPDHPAPDHPGPERPECAPPALGGSRAGRPRPHPAPGRPQPYPGPGEPTGHGRPGCDPSGCGESGYGQSGYRQAPHGPHHGQAYGAWGPPHGPPQPGSRVGLIAAVTGVALAVIAGLVVLILSLQSTVLDPAAVERDVAAQFAEREGVAIDLLCAEEMEVEEGGTYRCTGVTADGEEVTLRITVTDEATAAYTWTEP